MRAGGGFVAIHNAFGTLYNWPYYEGLIGGTNFYDHLPAREGDVVIVNRKDVSTSGLPSRFRFHDEWYRPCAVSEQSPFGSGRRKVHGTCGGRANIDGGRSEDGRTRCHIAQ
jgi:hypothetical protein